MSLTRLAWRSLRARPLRTLLSALGVALGVAVLFAGLATNAAIEASIDSTVSDLVGRSQLRVAAFGEAGLSPETQETIAETPGVRITAPAIQLRTYLGPDIEAGEALPPPVTVIGVDPVAEPQLHQLHIVTGSMLREPTEPSAMITEQLADEDGLTLGSPDHDAGLGRSSDIPGDRHPCRRRARQRPLRAHRRGPAARGAGASSMHPP